MDRLGVDTWASLTFAERRELLAAALREALQGREGVRDVMIEPGPPSREYDMTAVVETDVGRLRTPLWSHARASIYGDASIHPANRAQFDPRSAVREAADRLSRRLAVPYRLEGRGLTLTLSPEVGVERTWTAEHSTFRKRTAVIREDRVERAADVDVRDLLAHFYTGPSLRVVSEDGPAFLLPAASEAEGPLVTLCLDCRRWNEGAHHTCTDCGSSRVDIVRGVRPNGTG